MVEPTSGNEGNSVSRVNSFTKFIRSPSRPKSMKKSPSGGNSLTKLLFGSRKSSKKHLEDNEGDGSIGGAVDEQENTSNMVEEVKEVVETVIDNVIHRDDKQTSVEPETDAAVSTKSRDTSSTDVEATKDTKQCLLDKFKEELENKETTHYHFLGKFKEGLGEAKEAVKENYDKTKEHFLGKFKEGLGEAKEAVKENYDKAMEEVQTILQDKKLNVDISKEKKALLEEVVKAPANLAESVQEEVVAVVSSIDNDSEKPETTRQEESREIGDKKKEDGCVSTLAQGLQKMCAPWSSKKQE